MIRVTLRKGLFNWGWIDWDGSTERFMVADLCSPRAKLEAQDLGLQPGHAPIQTLKAHISH